ncbi:MAG: GNAT family N-acetyltransferase [Mangrovibacterium sp.]
MSELQLFQANQMHHPVILQLWEEAVRNTHHFLCEEDILYYKHQLETKLLDAVDLFCLQTEAGELLGFMGLKQIHLEMLFIAPAYHRKGLGTALLQTARQSFGVSRVEVNEQNQQAVDFYRKCGFEVIGRNALDGFGKPYPTLQMEISSAQAAVFVDWDNYADTWEDTPGVKDFAQHCFLDITSRFKLQGLRVLDFGCGTGLLTELLAAAGAEIVAVDASTRMIEMLQQKQLPHVQCLVSELSATDLYNQPAFQQPFDLIVASSVLAFVPNQAEKLAQLKSLLKEDGKIMQWDWLKVEEQADFGFFPEELEKLYAEAELNVINIGESFTVKSENGTFKALLACAENPSI